MGFWRDVTNLALRPRRRRDDNDEQYEEPAKQDKVKGYWIFKLLSYVAIIGIFIDVALLIVSLTISKLNSTMFMWIAIIGVVCIGSLQSLAWLKYLLNKEHKVLSIVNLCLVAINIIMWIISIVLLVQLWDKMKVEEVTGKAVSRPINFVRFAVVTTIQFSIANTIMSTILRVKKKWIPFQIIMYISLLYVDFYLSTLLFSFGLNASDGFYLTKGLNIIANPVCLSLIGITLSYVLISNAILNGGRRRRRRGLLQNAGIAEEIDEENERQAEQKAIRKQNLATNQERLKDLKQMLDDGIITEEEYKAKRQQIIDEM